MDSPASEREEDMELRLDELGRIAGTSQCGLDFSTRTASAQLTTAPTPDNPTVNVNGRAVGEGEGEGEETRPHESFPPHSLSRNEPNEDTQAALLASLRRDCRRVFCSESFWLGAGEEPRCGLEALARDVFALHTREVAFDADRSGAEWWVQVRDPSLDNVYPTVAFHWDKDEDLVDDAGINVFPQLSTVTYLSNDGAPTAIVDHTCGPVYGQDIATESIGSVTLCAPVILQHLVFDGRLLHGAPTELAADFGGIGYQAKRGRPRTRYTFIVNIWLNYKPSADPLPEQVHNLLELPRNCHFTFSDLEKPQCKTLRAGADVELRTFPFGAVCGEAVLSLPLPAAPSQPAAKRAKDPAKAAARRPVTLIYGRGLTGSVQDVAGAGENAAADDSSDGEYGDAAQ